MCTLFGWSKPTGPYAVGLSAWHVLDPRRPDPFQPDGPRAWMVQVWYPAAPAPEAKTLGGSVAFPEAGVWYPRPPGPLVTRQEPLASALRQLIPRYGLPGLAFHQVTHLQTHAYPEAPVAPGAAPCPLLLFSPGYFIETLTSSSALMEELASHGYVVASLSHPGESLATVFPDGRVVGLDLSQTRLAGEAGALGPAGEASLALWMEDAGLALDEAQRRGQPGSGDRLAGQLELGLAGALGVALGGTLAAELCRADPRCAAGVSLDGPTNSLERPFLSVYSEGGRGLNQAAHEQARQPTYQLSLRRARPLHLSGVSTWFPLLAQLADFEAGSVYRYQQALNGTVRAFFDRHLRGREAPLLDAPASEYPEAQLEADRP